MSKTILITRPNHDILLNFLYFWTERVVDLAIKKKFRVLDLKSKKSNKKNFDSYINRNNPSLVFFNGHGSSEVIAGHDDEPLVSADKDEHLLKGRVVYSRTCDSALVLGERSVKKVMLKNFFSMLSSVSTPGEKVVASYLWGNTLSQVLMGDTEARI